MRNRLYIMVLWITATPPLAHAQQKEDLSQGLVLSAETQASFSDGNTPLWLNANKYGLSSLDGTNGYMRVSALRPATADKDRKWKWGYGADVAVAEGYTSTLVVQQAFVELGWGHGMLSVGSKEYPMELKNQTLSSGSQTLGINARPVPQVRIALPDYWTIPGLKRWVHLKGHLAYGRFTDDNWQEDFTAGMRQARIAQGSNADQRCGRWCEDVLYNSKAGYLKIENREHIHNFSLELGVEMACQFGGKIHYVDSDGQLTTAKLGTGLSSYWHAFLPGGQDEKDGEYPNEEGNHVGSWMARLNYMDDYMGVSLYIDHFFEDQSGMILLDYDGYGEGDEWNERKEWKFYRFPLKDFMLGAEVNLKHFNWLKNIVFEYIYTKYQSGPYNHDRTENISDHLAGQDDYYNHSTYNSWQHWGQVMGNPLYLSPIYNEDGVIVVGNNRFKAFHLGLDGSPLRWLDYRILATWQEGWGTYIYPYSKKKTDFSALVEGVCHLRDDWHVTASLGMDFGEIRGDNVGFQLTVRKTLKRY